MKYKIMKNVEIDKKMDQFVNVSAQCMLKLLFNRFNQDIMINYPVDENADISYDFSMYGKELKKIKQDMGYTNDNFIDFAESYVRKL